MLQDICLWFGPVCPWCSRTRISSPVNRDFYGTWYSRYFFLQEIKNYTFQSLGPSWNNENIFRVQITLHPSSILVKVAKQSNFVSFEHVVAAADFWLGVVFGTVNQKQPFGILCGSYLLIAQWVFCKNRKWFSVISECLARSILYCDDRKANLALCVWAKSLYVFHYQDC